MAINHLLSLSWDDPPKDPLNSRPSPRKGRPSNSGWWTFTSSCRNDGQIPRKVWCFSPSFSGWILVANQTNTSNPKGTSSNSFFLVEIPVYLQICLWPIINLISICFDHQPSLKSISMLTCSEQQKPKSPNSPLSFPWPRTVKSSGKHVWTHSHVKNGSLQSL